MPDIGEDEEYIDPMAPLLEEPKSRPAIVYERVGAFERNLRSLINSFSEENESGTPDFILARYLTRMLDAYNDTIKERAVWRGESVELPALQDLEEGKRTVPLVVYGGHLRMENHIGEAVITITPGEQVALGKIQKVAAILEEENDGSH